MAESSDEKYITGTFLEELKNRFLCRVRVNQEDAICYIPSSCRLSNFLDLTGKAVLLRKNAVSGSRTRYAVYAVKCGRQFLLVNLSEANRVVENEIGRRFFSFLGKRKVVSHEVNIDGYKSDVFIEDTGTIIEIKSILSVEKTALVPTVYSERAVQQLKKLARLLGDGYKVCYMFVSLNPKVESVSINRSIPEFCEAFCECVNLGMEVCAVSVKLINQSPTIHKRIKVF